MSNTEKIVANLRHSKGWSVAELASKMSVNKQTVYNWEAGKTEPKLSQFLRLYALVGLDIGNILPKSTKRQDEIQAKELKGTDANDINIDYNSNSA